MLAKQYTGTEITLHHFIRNWPYSKVIFLAELSQSNAQCFADYQLFSSRLIQG